MAWVYYHQFYIFFQVAIIIVLLQWTIHIIHYSKQASPRQITSDHAFHHMQLVKSRKLHKDIKSINDTRLPRVTLSGQSSATPDVPVKPAFMPIVIFSSFRLNYTTKLLTSLEIAATNVNLDPDSPCIFILHKNKKVLEKDVNGMQLLLDNVRFCTVYKNINGAQRHAKRTAAMFKVIWYNAVKDVFENPSKSSLIAMLTNR